MMNGACRVIPFPETTDLQDLAAKTVDLDALNISCEQLDIGSEVTSTCDASLMTYTEALLLCSTRINR